MFKNENIVDLLSVLIDLTVTFSLAHVMVTSCTVLLFVSLLATGTRCSQFKTLCEVALVRQNWIPFKWFSSLQ